MRQGILELRQEKREARYKEALFFTEFLMQKMSLAEMKQKSGIATFSNILSGQYNPSAPVVTKIKLFAIGEGYRPNEQENT